MGGANRDSGRSVLQRSFDEVLALGNRVQHLGLILGVLLVKAKARGLLMARDTHNVTNERESGAFGRVAMDQAASVETAQLEYHVSAVAGRGPYTA